MVNPKCTPLSSGSSPSLFLPHRIAIRRLLLRFSQWGDCTLNFEKWVDIWKTPKRRNFHKERKNKQKCYSTGMTFWEHGKSYGTARKLDEVWWWSALNLNFLCFCVMLFNFLLFLCMLWYFFSPIYDDDCSTPGINQDLRASSYHNTLQIWIV